MGATLAIIRHTVTGKVVVDATVPLAEGNPTLADMPQEGSASERSQSVLPEARVVGAFHHVGAKALTKADKPIETDVLICGDDTSAKGPVLPLVEALEHAGSTADRLRMAQVLERITPMLFGLNFKYKRRHVSIRLTGL